MTSSNLATGSATTFIVLATLVGLVAASPTPSDTVHLRGSIAPDDTGRPPSSLPAASKPV